MRITQKLRKHSIRSCVDLMPHSTISWRSARGSQEKIVRECSILTKCLQLFNATPVAVLFVRGAVMRHMGPLSAMIRTTGGKLLKILLNLSKCLTIKPVRTARRQLRGDRAAIRLSVRASKNFVLFVGRNGCPIIHLMVTNLATVLRRLWPWIRKEKPRNKILRLTFWK